MSAAIHKVDELKQVVADLKGIPTRDALMEMLKKEVAVVTFKKLNGDERKMPCTLVPQFLPPAKKDDAITQKKVREISDKVIAVWALESKGFRSFRYDRVKNIEVMQYGNGTEDTANY